MALFSLSPPCVLNGLGGNCSQLVNFISTYIYPYQPVGLIVPPWGGAVRYEGADYGKSVVSAADANGQHKCRRKRLVSGCPGIGVQL